MWYQLSPKEIEEKLESNIKTGLSNNQVLKLIGIYGPNRIPSKKVDSIYIIFLKQFTSPLVFILLGAGIILLFLHTFSDALVIFIVLLFNAVIGTIQEGKARNTLSALTEFVRTNATVIRGKKEMVIPAIKLVPGDIILLQEGEKIPADARVIESYNLTLDEAALTGESLPVEKKVEGNTLPNLAISDQNTMVFKGTYVIAGNGVAIVTATGSETYIGKISKKITLIESEIPLKADIRNLSRVILIVTTILVSLIFLIGIYSGKSLFEMFTVAVSLSVSIIPEGLPIVLTVVLVSGVYRMAKKNALVKNLQAVEALGQARIIAVDKTGTITKNEMVVKNIFVNNTLYDVTGSGYDAQGEVLLNDAHIDPLNHPELILSAKIAAYCANAKIILEEKSNTFKVVGDPTEAAFLIFAQKIGFHKDNLEHISHKLSEIPFSHETKYHAVSYKLDNDQFIAVTGAPEVILDSVKYIMVNGETKRITKEDRTFIEKSLIQMSTKGLRVIACATATISIEKDIKDGNNLPLLTFIGFYGIQDALRNEVTHSIAIAQNAGIKIILITGDYKVTATAIAKEAGIYSDGDSILTSEDLQILSDEQLTALLPSVSVFARVTPDDKLRIIQAFKNKGDIIAMTGDGINDAPSLVAADLGIAMGKIGTGVAKEASDIILLDDNFSSIVAAIEEGRNIYKSIKRVILYLFSTSIGEVLTIAVAIILGYPLPLLATQILWLNLVTDGFLDVALAMEPKEHGLLKKSYVHHKNNLIDMLMVKRMIIMAIPMMFGTLILFNHYSSFDLQKAMTVSLCVLAAFQWFNAWNCRSDDKSIFTKNIFTNKYLIGATLITFSLQMIAIYTPFMQGILKTVPLQLFDWVIIFIVAFSIVLVEESRKLYTKLHYV